MKRHKTLLLRLATNLSSREAGFVFALLGVIVQACHTWFLAYDLSSLPGIWRLLQAGLMAIFISAALLYFTLKSSDDDSKQAKKYRKIVWWFACVEAFINLYYWGDHLLIKAWPNPDYGSFVIAIPFSILLPFVLKSYGSEVRTEDYSELEDDEPVNVDELNTSLDELIEEKMNMHKDDVEDIPLNEKIIYEDNVHEDVVPNEQDNEVHDESEHQLSEELDTLLDESHQTMQEIPEPEIPTEEQILSQKEEVNNELEETQEQTVPVIDAKGNDARETNEPQVVRPRFGTASKEQIVSIQNGAYTSSPAYVSEKK